MCCKKDDILTKKYQAKTEPIIAWKSMVKVPGFLESWGWYKSPGGTIEGPGEIDSDRETKESDEMVYKGCHAYLNKDDAGQDNLVRVQIIIQPEDVVAVGVLYYSYNFPVLKDGMFFVEIVCMKYTITQEEWDRIFLPEKEE